ncbi:YwpF family protein [Bacillus marasmi]|uniref:YwpF family protein n=1 Tax=Bacillus marasmi TaxID=1926279 RepID=UPI0011CB71C3|nr:YwpF family protein [Bacillus marasmi]
MKTFKLISLEVFENDTFREIELVDGLIINKEDEKNTWLIEIYTKPEQISFFEKAMQNQEDRIIRVVITKKDNDPVSFHIKTRSITRLEKNVSIMLQGNLKRTSRKNYSEILLKDLLDQGLNGDTLLEEFKEKMKSKPYLTPTNKSTSH